MMEIQNGLYPEGELAQTPLATPLSEPRLVSPTAKNTDDYAKRPVNNESSLAQARKRKHESYDLSGSVFLITGSGTTLQLPVPSDSPADPLAWGQWKRMGALLAVYWYSIVSLAVAQAASMMLREISHEFQEDDVRPWDMETLVTAPTLFMGVGAFVWVPLTIGLGRKPAFLLASLVMTLATFGAGSAQSFQQLLGCVCFLGLGEGFALTAAVLIVIDMSFIDERPRAIALLWSVTGFFGTVMVAIVPYMSGHGHVWRQYYRYWSITFIVSFILILVLYPETYFKRPTVAYNGLIVIQSATEKLTVFEDVEAGSELYRDLPDIPQERGFLGNVRRFGFRRSPFASWTSMGRTYLQIAFCAVNPLIFWVFFAASFNFAGMMFIGATYTRILRSPPYNLSMALITPVNISSGIGALVAYPVGIVPVRKLLNILTKRNHGVREAEHYLVGFILPVITGASSTLIYGLAVHEKIHFSAYYIAYGLNGFSWVTFSIAVTLWVVEAFPRWTAPALAVVGGGCYLISFSMSFALVPWVAANGYKVVGIQLSILQIISGLVAVPVAFWGKNARQAIHGRWANDRGGALRPL